VKAASWASFWDTIFQVSSVLLAICFGAALGNVVRGVPIGADGQFFEPLWADGDVPGQVGILDGYTVLVGVAALAALALHGALWLAYKLEGDVEARARRLARALLPVVAVASLIVTAVTFGVQPHVKERLLGAPAGFVFPALAVAGLVVVFLRLRRRDALVAVFGSAAYLAGMLTSAAYGCYPYLLPSTPEPSRGLTVNDAAADSTLSLSLWWWIPALAITIAYQVWIYRRFAGKVSPGEGHTGSGRATLKRLREDVHHPRVRRRVLHREAHRAGRQPDPMPDTSRRKSPAARTRSPSSAAVGAASGMRHSRKFVVGTTAKPRRSRSAAPAPRGAAPSRASAPRTRPGPRAPSRPPPARGGSPPTG
jgi:cytochrome d ubiquinol oxidase subunit II